MSRRQAVLGCGRWGGFHLWYGSRAGNAVLGWEPDPERLRSLRETGSTGYHELPGDVRLTADLADVEGSDLLLAALPSQFFGPVAAELAGLDLSRTDLVLCMKGLERGTGERMSGVAAREGVRSRSVVALLGPGHPEQLVAGVPSCMILASESEAAALRVSEALAGDLVRLYRSRDLCGCELGAAAKNVMGLAGGMLDGMGMGGLKGALIARAPQEVARLVAAAGGDWRSVYGLSHLGDYEATLFSPHSRNRLYGELLATGGDTSAVGLAEGVETSGAILDLARRLEVEMPITATVRAIIDGELSTSEAIGTLFGRPEKEEFPETFN